MEDFLADHTQIVILNGQSSSWAHEKPGVPRESSFYDQPKTASFIAII